MPFENKAFYECIFEMIIRTVSYIPEEMTNENHAKSNAPDGIEILKINMFVNFQDLNTL